MYKNNERIPDVIAELRVTYVPEIRPENLVRIHSKEEVIAVALPRWREVDARESMQIMLLNPANGVLGMREISVGGIDCTAVDVRIIIQTAILANAVGVIMIHNHPSGSLKPSEADRRLTNEAKAALETCKLKLLDHVIINGSGDCASFTDGDW